MKRFLGLAIFLFCSSAFANSGLVIHASEFGVGKFHRYDNIVHPYSSNHAWLGLVLPNSATSSTDLLVTKNMDGSYAIFFSNLNEMMASIADLSQQTGQKVAVLNLHGHGLPGKMWFPKDAAAHASSACSSWRRAADGTDEGNYAQYYSDVSVNDILQIRQLANGSGFGIPCTVGLNEWRAEAAKVPDFKSAIADDAQIHFLSCVVGLGAQGEAFTKGIAELLLPKGQGRVETSINFGLGDWSMPAGMGFWDMLTEEQVERDGARYVIDRKDSDIAQKGVIRISHFNAGVWSTRLLGNRDTMAVGFETFIEGTPVEEPRFKGNASVLPSRVRIPGTSFYLNVEKSSP